MLDAVSGYVFVDADTVRARPNSASACDTINGAAFQAPGSNKFLKIGFVGLMEGSWAKYSQGYCQVMTV